MKFRPFFALAILMSFYLAFVILAWIFKGITVVVSNEALYQINIDNQTFSLVLGRVPMATVLAAIALTGFYLVNEFFGFWAGVGASLAAGLMIGLCWTVMTVVPFVPFIENAETVHLIQMAFFDLTQRGVVMKVFSFTAGFIFVALVFDLFRKLFRGHASIFRIFFANIFGLIIFEASWTFWNFYPAYPKQEMLAFFANRYPQFLAFSIALIPLFYVLKVFALFFVGGEHARYMKARFGKKGKAFLPDIPFSQSKKDADKTQFGL